MSVGELGVLGVGLAAIVCDGLARHIYLTFRQVTGVPLADYTPFDRTFRKLDGRRNVYTVYMIVFALVGLPWIAVVLILAHAALTATVYAVSSGMSLRALDEGKTRQRR